MTEKVYIGTQLKYLVRIEASGFDMTGDEWEIEFRCKSKRLVLKKEDCINDDDGNWYALVDTSVMGKGELTAVTKAFIPDSDIPSGVRTETTLTTLAVLMKV